MLLCGGAAVQSRYSRHGLALPQRAQEGAEGVGVSNRRAWCLTIVVLLLASGWAAPDDGHAAGGTNGLPKIGPGPDFTLTTQDGARMSLRDLRRKVFAATFIYATCTDTCPPLTAKMAPLHPKLCPDFGPR